MLGNRKLLAGMLVCAAMGTGVFAGEQAASAVSSAPVKPVAKAVSTGEIMPDGDVDAFLEGVFKRNRELTAFTAALTEVKTGGINIRPSHTSGSLKVWMPRAFSLDMDGTLLLCDGTWLWQQIQGMPEDVERYEIAKYADKGEAFDLTALFFGAGVKTAAEVRQEFVLSGMRVAEGQVELTLLPKQEKDAKKMKSLVLRFAPEGLLPHYVRTEHPGVEGRRPAVVERTLSDIQTNLTGLAPFSADTFVFPYKKGMTVIDIGPQKNEVTLPEKQVLADLAKIRAEFEQKAAQKGKTQDSPAAPAATPAKIPASK